MIGKHIYPIGLAVLFFGAAFFAEAGWWSDWRKKSYEGYTKFHEAAKAGDVEKLAYYLQKGEDINRQSRSARCTALGCAVRWRKPEAARFLLEQGADPSISFRIASIRYTPLQMAARMGNEEMVKLLLPYVRSIDEGMNTIYQTGNRSAFSWACTQGNLELAELLLEEGADINARNFNYVGTPLIIAVKTLRIDVVRFLLENGADPAVSDHQRNLNAVEWAEAMLNKPYISVGGQWGKRIGHRPSEDELAEGDAVHHRITALLKAVMKQQES